jgi:nuclear pore complex protein Nup155
MLLGLASGNTFLDIGEGPGFGNIAAVGPDIAAVAKQAFYDFGERPIWAERMTYGTGESNVKVTFDMSTYCQIGDAQGTTIFSGRREGFALYFARLVWPLWKAKLTKPG